MDLSVAEMKAAINGKLLTKALYAPLGISVYQEMVDIDDFAGSSSANNPTTVEGWQNYFKKYDEKLIAAKKRVPAGAIMEHRLSIRHEYDYENTRHYLELYVWYNELEEDRIRRVYETEQKVKEERAKKAAKKAADKNIDVDLELDALMIRATKDKKLRAKLLEKMGQLPQ